jgi:hypothetical protein
LCFFHFLAALVALSITNKVRLLMLVQHTHAIFYTLKLAVGYQLSLFLGFHSYSEKSMLSLDYYHKIIILEFQCCARRVEWVLVSYSCLTHSPDFSWETLWEKDEGCMCLWYYQSMVAIGVSCETFSCTWATSSFKQNSIEIKILITTASKLFVRDAVNGTLCSYKGPCEIEQCAWKKNNVFCSTKWHKNGSCCENQ